MRKTMLFLALISVLCVFACTDKKDAAKKNIPQSKGVVSMDAISSPSNPEVVVKTNKGDIFIELYEKEAPITVQNFLNYVDKKFFDDTVFHRVISNFMIQGGGFTKDMMQKPTDPPIKNEADNGLKNDRGTIAMARTNVVDSATAQFFINVVDNQFLNYQGPSNYGYAVFGKVTTGMDIVDAIRNVKTSTSGPHADVPTKPVIIKSIRRVDK